MRPYWNSHKNEPLQNMASHVALVTKKKAPARPKEPPAKYTNIQHKSNNRKTRRCQETINYTGSSGHPSVRKLYRKKGFEIDPVNDAAVTSLTSSTPSAVNTESVDGFGNASHCMLCLAQSPRASKCGLIHRSYALSSSIIGKRI